MSVIKDRTTNPWFGTTGRIRPNHFILSVIQRPADPSQQIQSQTKAYPKGHPPEYPYVQAQIPWIRQTNHLHNANQQLTSSLKA
jgi:hypothetical protein